METALREMTLLEALVLGLLQGATEFLPVSSSGHLVIAQQWMGLREGVLVFDAVIHGGSLLAILWVFRSDLAEIWRSVVPSRRRAAAGGPVPGASEDGAAVRDADGSSGSAPPGGEGRDAGARGKLLLSCLVIATLPLVVVGLLARPVVDQAFNSVYVTPIMLYLTGVLLVLGERMQPPKRRSLDTGRALNVGLLQVLAVLPGLSRSGVTIAAGMMVGLSREQAARFSFLLAIPALMGATVLELHAAMRLDVANAAGAWQIVTGVLASAVATWGAVVLFLRFVKQRNLLPFALYCWVVASVFLLVVSAV